MFAPFTRIALAGLAALWFAVPDAYPASETPPPGPPWKRDLLEVQAEALRTNQEKTNATVKRAASPVLTSEGTDKAMLNQKDYDALTGRWQLVRSIVDGKPVPEAEVRQTVLITAGA
jgi:hypothetical protein